MARTLSWPAVDANGNDAATSDHPGLPEPEAFAASLGPELSRLFGLRTAARVPAKAGPAGPMVAVATLPLPADNNEGGDDSDGQPLLELLAPEADLPLLMELLFGGVEGKGEAAAHLPPLPPESASWKTLAGFLALAAGRALAAGGLAPAAPAAIPPRPAPATDAAVQQWLSLDLEGHAARLGLRLCLPQAATPGPAAHDPELWRRRARERALDVALPVSLRIAERRLPMGKVAALREGTILPLERPENVEVLVGGQPFARLPASHLIPPADGEEESR